MPSILIQLTAAVNSGNETTFNIVDSDGAAVDLDALNATVVTVSVSGSPVPCGGSASIDSSTDDVAFAGSVVSVKFGKLPLPPTRQAPYLPKVSYVTTTDLEPEVIAGEGFNTEIRLKVVD